MAKRQWFKLGETVIDFAQVVKIVYIASEARLYSVAGEALLLIGSTKAREEIAALKTFSAIGPDSAWIKVLTNADDPDTVDQRLNSRAIDRIAFTQTKIADAAELFISGVYAGQVAGELAISQIKKKLGIETL